MNITLTADERLVRKAREYAGAHNTTLNQLIREYMERLTGRLDASAAAEEFSRIARSNPGRSPDEYRFDRESIHQRNA